MPRSKLINLSFGDIAPADMTLKMQYWEEELSPAQLAAYEQAEQEHNDIKAKLNEVVTASGAENVYLGEIFGAYQVSGVVAGLENISKPVAAVRKENKARQLAEEKRIRADREREAARKRDNAKLIEVIDDDDDDEEYLPLSKRMAAKKNTAIYGKPKELPKPVVGTRGKGVAAPIAEKVACRPSEGTAVGGLTVGETKKKEVVDLTKDEPASSKLAADSREVTFNKLQGKTFPSLVVVARPTLKIKETNINDRPALDAKVKSVLMQSATKYTEWLIQQGLVRSEQTCQIHPRVSLKLGMYSDASKFPYSGGYVWISDCCPSRFVSVFSGSLFEAAPHPPSVLLKLIYHWSCQTNVQNVVQWVKVDNLYVKGLFTWLRAVCTVALHQHMTLLGGPGKRIEVGVISLGTTSQGGQQKQVKVEVLGVLDPVTKVVRLRAVEPLADGEKNYKKRFAKILEPLALWVNKTSIIATDLTVDKGTLLSMGYKFINQSTTPDGKYTNSNIMDYLRTVVPRMFQNTLSLLSRQIIQQFLDELVWREWYGTTPGKTFDHIVSHIAEQTRFEGSETLVNRLSKVAANPFRDWGHLSVRSPAKALRSDFFTAGTSNSISSAHPVGRPSNRNKRKEPSPPPVPTKKQKIVVKEEPKYKVKLPPKREEPPPPRKEPKIFLESFYYGIYETGTENDSGIAVKFEAECPECHETFTKNIDFMDHIKKHVIPDYNSETDKEQCRYCLKAFPTTVLLDEHMASIHPTQTAQSKGNGKPASSFKCIICRSMFQNVPSLSQHMEKFHVAAEMPFKCGCCDHMSSSQRYTIDHFYSDHTASGALQCPFCLKIIMAVAQNQQLVNNIKLYYDHLKDHMTPEKVITCSKCSLRFLHKGAMKAHRLYEHNSQTSLQRHLRELVKDSTQIGKPKFKNFTPREAILSIQNLNHVTMNLPNGYICLECGEDFQENNHIRSVSKCAKCKYQSACSRAILEHISNCNGEETTDTTVTYQLGSEMFCICGYSSSEGNDLARHLATCDRKSAYESSEVAQSNTVKCNMLDMLGLVRRDGEDEEDSSDGLLIPADQQQQLLSKSIDRENENEKASQPTSTQNPSTSVPAAAAAAPNAMDDFNTQLSLDDLAPPQSVAPQPEPDRTPQLSDEYQSLATPRVAYNAPQYENNDYEMAPNN